MKTGGTILMTLGLIIFLLLALTPNSKNNNEKKNDQLFDKLWAMTPKKFNTPAQGHASQDHLTIAQQMGIDPIEPKQPATNGIGKPGDPVKKKAKKKRELSSSELADKLLGRTPGTTPAKKESSSKYSYLQLAGLEHAGKKPPKDTDSGLTLFQRAGIDPIDSITTPKDSKLTDKDLRQMGLLSAKDKESNSSRNWFLFVIPTCLMLIGFLMIYKGSYNHIEKPKETESEENQIASAQGKYTMPSTRKIILLISSMVVAAIILFPPTYYYAVDRLGKKTTVFSGYQFIGKLESNTHTTQIISEVNPDVRIFASILHIEPVRLTYQLICLLLITGFLVIAFPETDESNKP